MSVCGRDATQRRRSPPGLVSSSTCSDGLARPDESGITPSDVSPSRSPAVHIVQITAQFDCNHALNMELVWRGAFLIMGNL